MQTEGEQNFDIHPEELTETERLIIANVLSRDEEIRRQERKRLSELKQELHVLKEKSVKDGEEEEAGRVCMRCQTPLGLIFSSGALCPTCQKRVCKDCRVPHEESWDCTYCNKVREIKAESGVWFYDHATKQKRNLYGTALLTRLFKKAPRRVVNDLQDPIWSDFDETESGLGSDDDDSTYLMLSQRDDGEISVREGKHPDHDVEICETISNNDYHNEAANDTIKQDIDIDESKPQKINLLAMVNGASSLHTDNSNENNDGILRDESIVYSVPTIQIVSADEGENTDDDDDVDEEKHDDIIDTFEHSSSDHHSSSDAEDNDEVERHSYEGYPMQDSARNAHGDDEHIQDISHAQLALVHDVTQKDTYSDYDSIVHNDQDLGRHNDLDVGQELGVAKVDSDVDEEDSDASNKDLNVAHRDTDSNHEHDIFAEKVAVEKDSESCQDNDDNDDKMTGLLISTSPVYDDSAFSMPLELTEVRQTDVHDAESSTDDESELTAIKEQTFEDEPQDIQHYNQNKRTVNNEDNDIPISTVENSSVAITTDANVIPKDEVQEKDVDEGNEKRLSLNEYLKVSIDPNSPNNSKAEDFKHVDTLAGTLGDDRPTSNEAVSDKYQRNNKLFEVDSYEDEDDGLLGRRRSRGKFKQFSFAHHVEMDQTKSDDDPNRIVDDINSPSVVLDTKANEENVFHPSIPNIVLKRKQMTSASILIPATSYRGDVTDDLNPKNDDSDGNESELTSFIDDDIDGIQSRKVVQQSSLKIKNNSDSFAVSIEDSSLVFDQNSRDEADQIFSPVSHLLKSNVYASTSVDSNSTMAATEDEYPGDTSLLTSSGSFESSFSTGENLDLKVKIQDDDYDVIKNEEKKQQTSHTEYPDNEMQSMDVLALDDIDKEPIDFETRSSSVIHGIYLINDADDDDCSDAKLRLEDSKAASVDADVIDIEVGEAAELHDAGIIGVDGHHHSDSDDCEDNKDVGISKSATGVMVNTEQEQSLFKINYDEYQKLSLEEEGDPASVEHEDQINIKLKESRHVNDNTFTDDAVSETINAEIAIQTYSIPEIDDSSNQRQDSTDNTLMVDDERQHFSDVESPDCDDLAMIKTDVEATDDNEVVYKATDLNDSLPSVSDLESNVSAEIESTDTSAIIGNKSIGVLSLSGESSSSVSPHSLSPMDEDIDNKSWKDPGATDLGNAILLHMNGATSKNIEAPEDTPSQSTADTDDVQIASLYSENTYAISQSTEDAGIVSQSASDTVDGSTISLAKVDTNTDVVKTISLPNEEVDGAVLSEVVTTPEEDVVVVKADLQFEQKAQYDESSKLSIDNKEKKLEDCTADQIVSLRDDGSDMDDNETKDLKFLRRDDIKDDEEMDVDAYFNAYKQENNTEEIEESSLGEIFLDLQYDESTNKFDVIIHKARDLIMGDTSKRTTDAYVKAYLLPDTSKNGKRKTKTKKHTQSPDYDETLTYNVTQEDLLTSTLSCSIWHHDSLGKNVFLGEIEIGLKSYIANGGCLDNASPKWYTLTEKKITKAELTFAGELSLKLNFECAYGSNKGSLCVQLIEGSNLKAVESDGTSSPYCILSLLPDNIRRKSLAFPKSVFPIWDEGFKFPNLSLKDLETKVLQIMVYDTHQKTLLGCVRLGSGENLHDFDDSFDAEIDAWKTMLTDPNNDNSLPFNVPLRSSSGCLRSITGPLPSSMAAVKVKEKKEPKSFEKSRTSSTTSATGITNKHLGALSADQYSLKSYGSLTSVYSSSGGHHNNFPITGEILFGIRYDNIAGIFELHLKKAKDIAAANPKTNSSDPYVKAYLLPDKSKKSKKKSLVKKKSLNPEWNELIKYKIKHSEIINRTLHITIWNSERFGHNDFLGEVQVKLSDYIDSGKDLNVPEPIWYTLQEMAPVSVSATGKNGVVTVGLKYVSTGDEWGKLIVDVKKADDLCCEDEDSIPSAFVKCYLLPDKSRKAKRKTSIKKKSSPMWNDKLEFDNVSLEDLRYRVLELTVWDHDVRGHNFLGGCRLGLQQGDELWHDCDGAEIRVWDAMLDHPSIWSEFDVPLRGTMKSNREEQRLKGSITDMSVMDSEALILGSGSVPNLVPGEAYIKVGLNFLSGESVSAESKKKPKGLLQVHLERGKYLKSLASGDFPDLYCKCILHHNKKSVKQQTKVFRKSGTPEWDEKVSFNSVAPDTLAGRVLEIKVVDDNGGRGKELIGSVHLGLGESNELYDDCTGREVALWNEMLQNNNEWARMMISVRVPLSTISQEEEFNAERQRSASEANEVENVDNSGRESPRTLALRAMGEHATEVLDIMDQSSTSTGPQLIAHYHNDPEDIHASLGTIQEEPDLERSGSMSSPAVSQGSLPSALSSPVKTEETVRPRPPSITITPESQSTTPTVRPGDPPFPAANKTSWEEEEDTISLKSKSSKISKTKMFGSTDSLASQTSESLAIYGRVVVTGSVQFAMRYDFNASEFEVHAYSARDIAVADIKRMTSDSYFKVALFPDQGRKYGKKKTKVVKGTTNPEWDEIMKMKIKFRELSVKTLVASVWNYDRFGRNEFLGETRILLDDIVKENGLTSPIVRWYTLDEKQMLKPYILHNGVLNISLKFEDEQDNDNKAKTKKKASKKKKNSKLYILIRSGKDLPVRDHNGLSDPYCKCYILPDRSSKTKRKTAVIKRTLNPVWDFTMEYDFGMEDFQDTGVELSVFDWDLASQNDFIGCVRLGLGFRRGDWDDAEGIEIDVWQKAMNEHGVWHEASLPLRSVADPRPRKIEDQ